MCFARAVALVALHLCYTWGGLRFTFAGFGCVIALQTTLHTYAQETWLARFGYCGENDATLTVLECTTSHVSIVKWYIGCTTWSLLLITGHGPGEYPYPYSVAENVVIALLQLASALMWTVILAAFCDIATNSNPEAILFRQTSACPRPPLWPLPATRAHRPSAAAAMHVMLDVMRRPCMHPAPTEHRQQTPLRHHMHGSL